MWLFPQALMRDSTPENIVTMYMLTVETLLLIDQIRRIWQTGDFTQFASLLFLKDGPLTLPTRSGAIADTSESTHVSLLTDALQQFFSYAAQRGVPLYVVALRKVASW